MKRRRFLGAAAAAAVSAAVPTVGWSLTAVAEPSLLAEPDLVRILGSRRAVMRIGELYRQAHPSEDDAAKLQRVVAEGLPSTRSARGLRRQLDEKIRDDFAAGRIVQVDGWVLSRTEARQCALLALSSV